LFFFSSRRRHTRSKRDWSSDVCSSDLQTRLMETHFVFGGVYVDVHLMRVDLQIQHKRRLLIGPQFVFAGLADRMIDQAIAHHARSEERRVGKEGRSGWGWEW